VDTGFVVTNPDSYDSADTAVLVDINEVDKTVTLLNLDICRRYTLSMDGTTRFGDKYGKAISLDQLQEGDIVDVTFLKTLCLSTRSASVCVCVSVFPSVAAFCPQPVIDNIVISQMHATAFIRLSFVHAFVSSPVP